MRFFNDFTEFVRETGRMFWDDFADLDLDHPYWDGIFEKNELPKLLEFCEKYPSHHIMTLLDGASILNKIDYDGACFLLGKGNPDPDLMYVANNVKLIWPDREYLQKVLSKKP